MAHDSCLPGRAPGFFPRVAARIAEWRSTFSEIRAEAAIARKLDGVDDHLLRDMGLKRSGRRVERLCDPYARW